MPSPLFALDKKSCGVGPFGRRVWVGFDNSGTWRICGYVQRKSRVARKGLGGGVQPFYTATVTASAPSLGTRHQTAEDAYRAIQAFWRFHFEVGAEMLNGNLSLSVAKFKQQNPQVCGRER
jgi:hypothetical protein